MRIETEELIKQQASQIVTSKEQGSSNSLKKVATRFGDITINTDKAILFQHGLLGIPGRINFCVSEFPSENMQQFKLLQCVEDDNLCFITIPAEINNNVVSEADLIEGCKTLSINPNDLVLFFIVTVHRDSKNVKISINARAPIFTDLNSSTATQFVLSNPEYKVQHFIS